MSQVAAPTLPFVADHDAFVAAHAAPAGITALRTAGLAHFQTLGLPTSRDEDWLYTNVAPIARGAFPPAPAAAEPPTSLAAQRFALGLDEGPRLVFLNGRYEASLSSVAGLPAGVELGHLAGPSSDTAIDELGSVADAAAFPLVALNQAFLHDGASLRIGAGVTVEEPIQLLFLHTPTGAPAAVHPRILVVAERGSRATIVERYGIDCVGAVAGGTCFTNAVAEYVLEENAALHTVRVQREGTSTYHVGFTAVRQARDSRYSSTSVSLGGALDRNEVRVRLAAEGAECDLHGLYVITNEEHADVHTVVHHDEPYCRSAELFKGILGGKARGAFTGRVVVAEGAQKTAATQANHNLLLSKEALARTRPQLEIYADDVQCTHGATIGRLDEEALYYMRSRGIGERAARNLLVHAFASEVTAAAGDPRLTEGLEALLASRLARAPHKRAVQ